MTRGLSVARAVVGLFLLAQPQAGHAQTAPQPAEPARPAATFRSSVDVVSVSAVVRDRKGRFVSNMAQKDFLVSEGGRPREILEFRSEIDGPVRVAILFDISGSMRVGSKAVDAQQAARQLLSVLRPQDQAAVFAFDTRLDRVIDFTSDRAKLEAAFGHVDVPFGQTSMYDAMAETARAAAAGAERVGRLPWRTAVVVLTDGVDTRSRMTPEEVSGVASAIDVPVYIVSVMSSIDDTRNEAGSGEASGPLANLAHWTGGAYFPVTAPAHAATAARQIVEELRHQYVLAFEASTVPGWRPLEVRARDRDLVVRARAGYIVGGSVGQAER